MTAEQRAVLAYTRAFGHAVPIRAIAHGLRLPRRTVEEAVQQLRLLGEPLVSDGDGIRYTTDPVEVRECANKLRRRYITQALTARALRHTATRLEKPTLGLI